MVFCSRPLSLRYFITEPTMSSSCAMPASCSDQPFSELRILLYLSERCVTTCMRVGLSQRKNGFLSARALSRNFTRVAENFVVHRLHPLRTKLAVVFDPLLADLAPARLHRRIVDVGGPAVHHVARTDRRLELLRIVHVAGIFHRIEMVEIAVELIEAVDRRQKLVEIAEMVLAELAGGIAHGLERGRDGRRLRPAFRSVSLPDRPWSDRCGSAIRR